MFPPTKSLVLLLSAVEMIQGQDVCTSSFLQQCQQCQGNSLDFNCSLPGLQDFTPGVYEGVSVNYLSFVTDVSSPSMPIRAAEFEKCTGAKIVISEANNVFEDPVQDLGTKTAKGGEVYDGYFMSYSHFPEVSALDLAEHLNERIRADNDRLKWEDVMPKVRTMGEYRKDGVTNIDFLSYDGDFFVPLIRLDLLEKHDFPLPNTWDEVLEIVKYFHGMDLNEDGEPDYGLCHFPRLGAGYWDWWFPEIVYSTWATTDQTAGIDQGFHFDTDTMEPRTGEGLRRAALIWKELWENGEGACDGSRFETGRCAVGYGPPGCWKGVFLNGVSRTYENPFTNTTDIVWQPTMKSGEYAEPYQFKPFGSVDVVDRGTGEMVACNPETCPKAERIPARGHHGDDDRASVLRPSPLEGRLINRAPFYWSGGLGTLIRKSSTPLRKDVMWDFFVYTNSPDTSIYDVAHYPSWLDSWRHSQVDPGSNFANAGWSENSYIEHRAVQEWGLSTTVNGAFNLRLPGVAKYTRDIMGTQMGNFINNKISVDVLLARVKIGWDEINIQKDKLHQLETYRASLGLDAHSEVDLCRLHRDLMDQQDPTVCLKYDPSTVNEAVIPATVSAACVVIAALLGYIFFERRRHAGMVKSIDEDERDEVLEIQRLTHYDNVGVQVLRVLVLAVIIISGFALSVKCNQALSSTTEDHFEAMFYKLGFSIQHALSKHHNGIRASVENMANILQLQQLPWPLSNLTTLDLFAQRDISSVGFDGLGILTYVLEDDIEAFTEFQTETCSDMLKKRHDQFYGNYDRFVPGSAGDRTGYLTLANDTIVQNTERNNCAILTYHFPPESSCEVQSIDLLSGDSPLSVTVNSAISTGKIMMSPMVQNKALFQYIPRAYSALEDTKNHWPRSLLMAAVHSSQTLVSNRVVAVILADAGFDVPLRNLVPPVVSGKIEVVFKNSCAQTSVYQVGSETAELIYFGGEDWNADGLEYSFSLIQYDTSYAADDCRITVTIFETESLRRGFFATASTFYVYSLAISFGILLAVFAAYDWLVRNRNRKLVLNAAKSSELITKMFPDQIRERLLEETKTNKKARVRWENKAQAKEHDEVLAELYPRATVCFADISGFSAWASSRQPQQVFSLLERVFGAFDSLARRNRVYKVETIGDCYVAITGAPNEQRDHAMIMCRFATSCVKRFSSLVRNLTSVFGPDTAELKLRIGIHSGQVTMGVLRNDRARYQLFGDCVNTASRMESTGQSGRIQISRETADILFASGKENWLIPRDNTVSAKGKGILDTFWLNTHAVKADTIDTTSSGFTTSQGDATDLEEGLTDTRLVSWNTEILLSLLKKIIAHRQETPVKPLTESAKETFSLDSGKTYLDEVTDIIHLPKSNGVDIESVDLGEIEVDPKVTHELRCLVESIADTYNANPFHSFEHASHVVMSIVRLLSRIVKPSAKEVKMGDSAEFSSYDHSYGITSDPLTQFACAFCGLIHDADHPGVPNGQLIHESPMLGSRYKERSVAEQNSLNLCFNLLCEDRFSNLRRALFSSNDDQARFRELVVNSVLATDIADKELKELRNGRWKKAFSDTPIEEPVRDTVNRKATIVIEHLIQASDVSHTMQHWNVYRKWNERLLQEMYLAYKNGRSTTDPTVDWAKGEIGFFDFYVIPLAKKLKDCGVFGVSSDEYLNYALINRRKWEVEGPAITAAMVEQLTKAYKENRKIGGEDEWESSVLGFTMEDRACI